MTFLALKLLFNFISNQFLNWSLAREVRSQTIGGGQCLISKYQGNLKVRRNLDR